MAGKFHHFGVPTSRKSENETFLEGAGVHITDPDSSPYRIEFLRFESDSCMPEAIQSTPHAAFMVDSLDEAIQGKQVVLEPFDATDTLRVAFIQDGDALIEVMQEKS
ncbi:MAG: hypothetical protein JXA82_04915 [Sedimentisphaerales bacterium]|nr:hypothetical protein [Sedimentisphaerales bacterium]